MSQMSTYGTRYLATLLGTAVQILMIFLPWLLPHWLKMLIYLDFPAQSSLGFTENGWKTKKYVMSGSYVGEKLVG